MVEEAGEVQEVSHGVAGKEVIGELECAGGHSAICEAGGYGYLPFVVVVVGCGMAAGRQGSELRTVNDGDGGGDDGGVVAEVQNDTTPLYPSCDVRMSQGCWRQP